MLVCPRAGGREFSLLNITKILMPSFRWLDISVSQRPRRSSVPVSRTRKNSVLKKLFALNRLVLAVPTNAMVPRSLRRH